MGLKNIFDIVKADRYTQDGREEIIKAHESEVEDRTYNIGEISQKTGKMKTANGWIDPPKGKNKGAKAGAGESPKSETKPTGSKLEEKKAALKEIESMIDNAGDYDDIEEMEKERQKLIKEIKKEEKSAPSKPAEEKPKAPKPSTQEYMKAKDIMKKHEEQYKKEMDDYEYMERLKSNGVNPSIFNPMYGGKPQPLENRSSYKKAMDTVKAYEAQDAAPRQLTGDCKIRIKK